MSEDKQNLSGRINTVKKAVAAKRAAGLIRRGGCDDSQHRKQED
jgi:hypothetical protein